MSVITESNLIKKALRDIFQESYLPLEEIVTAAGPDNIRLLLNNKFVEPISEEVQKRIYTTLGFTDERFEKVLKELRDYYTTVGVVIVDEDESIIDPRNVLSI